MPLLNSNLEPLGFCSRFGHTQTCQSYISPRKMCYELSWRALFDSHLSLSIHIVERFVGILFLYLFFWCYYCWSFVCVQIFKPTIVKLLHVLWRLQFKVSNSLQEILYYVTIQFATTCDYLSFVTMFYNFYT